MLSALLIASSILTIGNTSAVMGYYNGPVATPKDNKFTLAVVYMVLACLGVVIGLWSLLFPEQISFVTKSNFVSTGLVLVWLVVTTLSAIQARQIIGELATTFMVEWVIIAALVIGTGYVSFNYEDE